MAHVPKRLFDIVSMETVMYDDIVDDVKEKGYVAISHVWGDQKKYAMGELGIVDGINWEIPLSDPNKIRRIVDAMTKYGKKYCWFDVLCMPQDKQEEINLEIPFMGDYYAGADLTIALSDMKYVISQDFITWSNIMDDVIGESRELTRHEHNWMGSYVGPDILDMCEETWLTRVWTLQEAAMSKEIVLVDTNGLHIFLSSVLSKISHMMDLNRFYMLNLFAKCEDTLIPLSDAIADHANGNHDVIVANNNRTCFRPQDKFYGTLGILGYRDFSVDYDISTKDLNDKIVRYAFSRGDISWIGIGGNAQTGFIQPIHNKIMPIGINWKEDEPGICAIVFRDDILSMNVFAFGTVVCCEKFPDYSKQDFLRWAVRTFKSWDIDDHRIVDVMTRYIPTCNGLYRILTTWIDDIVGGMDRGDAWIKVGKSKNGLQNMVGISERIGRTEAKFNVSTIVVVAVNDTGKNIPLVISGDANVGDEVKLLEMHDEKDRSLGIVCKSGERKGIFAYMRYLCENCTPYEFLL